MDCHNVDIISLSWILSILDLNYFFQNDHFLLCPNLMSKDIFLGGKLNMLEIEDALRGKIIFFILLFLDKGF